MEGSESSSGAELECLLTRVTGIPAMSFDVIGRDGAGNGVADTKVGAAFNVDVSNVKDDKYRIANGKMDFANLQVPGPLFPFDSTAVHAGQRMVVESAGAVPAANGNLSSERITLQQQALLGTVSAFAITSNGSATFDLNLPSDGSSFLTVPPKSGQLAPQHQ